ncbi:MAG TPA: cupin domain-containing protein, partial [Myxococcales bacterium]|nr:cupin domain-containing protein [Myxococcales bacterium]
MKRTSLLQCDTATLDHGSFAFKRKRLGAEVGSKGLGTSWFELPPGKKAFPFHFHLANEEAIFILEGEGVLRSGTDEQPLRQGDYISFPPGPPGHQ